jgi:hypothetical protein
VSKTWEVTPSKMLGECPTRERPGPKEVGPGGKESGTYQLLERIPGYGPYGDDRSRRRGHSLEASWFQEARHSRRDEHLTVPMVRPTPGHFSEAVVPPMQREPTRRGASAKRCPTTREAGHTRRGRIGNRFAGTVLGLLGRYFGFRKRVPITRAHSTVWAIW